MAAREEMERLLFYVLSESNRQLLVTKGLDSLPSQTRVAALRGLQDLGWIGHGGLADYESSYSLTKEGRRIAHSQPSIDSFPEGVRKHIENLRDLDSGTGCSRKKALRTAIISMFERGNWDSTLMTCIELRGIAKKTKDAEAEAFARFYEGRVEMIQNRWEEALESNLSAVEMYMEMGDRKGVCEANRALGIVYGNRGDHDSAIRCFESSLAMAELIGDDEAAARTEANLAIVYDLQGRYEESEDAGRKCLDWFLRNNDMSNACRTANNLGVLNLTQEKFAEAAEYFEKTISSCRQIGNMEVLGAALVNAGYCYSRIGDLNKALTCTDEAVSVFKEPNNLNMLALAYRNYGALEFRNSNRERAFEWFEKSVRTAKASKVDDTFAACCYEYGMCLIRTAKDPRLAKKLLKKSAVLYKDVGNNLRARAADRAASAI